MTAVASVGELAQAVTLAAGTHTVEWTGGTEAQPLVTAHTPGDEPGLVSVARLRVEVPNPRIRQFVLNAIVRAGARHPGLAQDDRDLLEAHREASRAGHVELFTDLNALSTGLLQQVARSLGRHVARVVLASSSVDVLHQQQSQLHDKRNQQENVFRREMGRAMRSLEELRSRIPVHIHQLPPGASRYASMRSEKRPAPDDPQGDPHDEPPMSISEDRQMIAAFWDYHQQTLPRLPVIFVTSDHTLARVCAAERVRCLFVPKPSTAWELAAHPAVEPEVLWFDPWSLSLRSCAPHAVLWELALVFGRIALVHPDGRRRSLTFDEGPLRPGRRAVIALDDANDGSVRTQPAVPKPTVPKPTVPKASPPQRGAPPVSAPVVPEDDAPIRPIRVAFKTLTAHLPLRPGQRLGLEGEGLRDSQARRHFEQLGLAARIYHVDGDAVVGDEGIDEVLECLRRGDHVALNAIFRRFRLYDQALSQAREVGRVVRRSVVDASVGWAVALGAGYKTSSGVLFGLAEPDDPRFEQEVIAAHRTVGDDQAAVPVAPVLDRVCRALQMSPVRFQARLTQAIGRGALSRFELQRSTPGNAVSIPAHDVMVSPAQADPSAWLETFFPEKGVRFRGKLTNSLVRRSGDP